MKIAVAGTGKEYIPSRRTIRHVDAVLKFMSVMTGDERFSEVQKAKKDRRRQDNVCDTGSD